MTLQDLIDQLTALQPASTRDAQVVVGVADGDCATEGVRYSDGIVTIETDADQKTYDEAYDDGYAEGYKAGRTEDEAEDDD